MNKKGFYNEYHIIRVEEEKLQEKKDLVIREYLFTILLNGQEIVTLNCSPDNLIELAVGFIFSAGFINNKADLKEVKEEFNKGIVSIQCENGKTISQIKDTKVVKGSSSGIIYSNPGNFFSTTKNKNIISSGKLDYKIVYEIIEKLHHLSIVFKKTGGVHNSLLTDINGQDIVFREDIGRHNTIDKIIGHLVLNELTSEDKVVVLSGRISSEILQKIARVRIPFIVSAAAPTDLAIQLAEKMGITLIGFVRNKKMNIYTCSERVKMKKEWN